MHLNEAVPETALTAQKVLQTNYGNGAWGGSGPGGGQDGPGVSLGSNKSSCVGIAALNTSVKDNKNLLEIRLERSAFSVSFNLSQVELVHLLTIDLESTALTLLPRGERCGVCYSASVCKYPEIY